MSGDEKGGGEMRWLLILMVVAIPKITWDGMLQNEQRMFCRDVAEVYGLYNGCPKVSVEAYDRDEFVVIHYQCKEAGNENHD